MQTNKDIAYCAPATTVIESKSVKSAHSCKSAAEYEYEYESLQTLPTNHPRLVAKLQLFDGDHDALAIHLSEAVSMIRAKDVGSYLNSCDNASPKPILEVVEATSLAKMMTWLSNRHSMTSLTANSAGVLAKLRLFGGNDRFLVAHLIELQDYQVQLVRLNVRFNDRFRSYRMIDVEATTTVHQVYVSVTAHCASVTNV